MTSSTEKERAEFEAVIVGQWPSLVPVWNTRENRYFDTKVRKLWWLWKAARRAPVVPEENVSREKLEDWKRRVNTLASCGLKDDRYRFGSALKQEIADAIAAAPEPQEPT